jgi:3-deoxy-D-manno-octulosonate 8-phosphate phosphatase (KDO 8-P phosphatase)
MHYLFSNIKLLLKKEGRDEEKFYVSLGFSYDLVFQLITGNAPPSPEQLILISDSLNYSIDDLLRKDLTRMADLEHTFRMMVLDVDGVMTDGGMYYTDSGLEIKKYNAKDGLAIMRLEKNGIPTGMLSHGFNRSLIRSRAEMLRVSFHYTGQDKKWDVLNGWLEKAGISPEEVIYLGDDINDLDVMERVGFSAAPSDAAAGVKRKVNLVLGTKGGEGCVRELAELLFPGYFL